MHIYELLFFLYSVLKHFSKSWTQMNPQIHTFDKLGISSRLKMHVSTHYFPTPILKFKKSKNKNTQLLLFSLEGNIFTALTTGRSTTRALRKSAFHADDTGQGLCPTLFLSRPQGCNFKNRKWGRKGLVWNLRVIFPICFLN